MNNQPNPDNAALIELLNEAVIDTYAAEKANLHEVMCDNIMYARDKIKSVISALQPPMQADCGEVEGWTGKKCLDCNGTGENDNRRNCVSCAGTGEEYAALPRNVSIAVEGLNDLFVTTKNGAELLGYVISKNDIHKIVRLCKAALNKPTPTCSEQQIDEAKQ